MLDQNLVLKCDELYLVGNISTDGSGERATGLYARDTRFLSTFRITLNGYSLEQLAVQPDGPADALVICSNPLMTMPDGSIITPQKILAEMHVSLSEHLSLTVTIQHFLPSPQQLTLGFEVAADFRDLFDIRGYPRAHRGQLTQPKCEATTIDFGYLGLDELITTTLVRFDREPDFSSVRTGNGVPDQLVPRLPSMTGFVRETSIEGLQSMFATFPIELSPRERWSVCSTVVPRPPDGRPLNASAQPSSNKVAISTDHHRLNQVLHQSLSDLDALQTTFPGGQIPAAGIPWFVAPFGRDSLITSLQTLHLNPERSVETLRVLASYQGDEVDPVREEEPGKILHEMRFGEMSRLKEIPHAPYYGTVDATPLFVWLFAEAVAWTGDRALFDSLLPNAERAIEWIETYGDLDGDGLVEYRIDHQGIGRITHQVWKDSHDSLNHPDGSPLVGPIAPVEVQGYVFAACSRLAEVMHQFGDQERAAHLRAKADQIRNLVESLFWMESEGYYSQALDGDKRQVTSLSSNPGHLLLAGLPSPDRASRVIARMSNPDLDSGWGIRTLATGSPTYNPMSYHNGSVWPHDNSMIGVGMFRYGLGELSSRIVESMIDAGSRDHRQRLPELFCGFPRERPTSEVDSPVRYPVSCSPQAWAAGALPFLIRGMLGLDVDPVAGLLKVRPDFPTWLNRIELTRFSVLGATGSLTVERTDDGYRVIGPRLPLQAPGIN